MRHIAIDGKTDGFGAQYLAKMSGVAYSHFTENCCYLHVPFREMEHLASETVEDMNRFVGLVSHHHCEGSPETAPFRGEVHRAPRPSVYYTPEVRQTLREMYDTSTVGKHNHGCDIAFHIRRGDVGASDTYRYTPNSEVRQHLDKLSSRFPAETICVLSEGKPEDFDVGNAKVVFKLNEDVRQTFHTMVTSPRIVVSKSTFPYSAALLNTGHIMHYLAPSGGHRPLDHWEDLA